MRTEHRISGRLGVLLLTGAVLVAGCGGGGSSAKKSNDSTATSASSPKAAAKAAKNGAPSAGGDFCSVVKSELTGLKAVFPKDFTDAEQVKAYGRYVKTDNARMRAAAPAAIRSDVEVLSRVSDLVADTYLAGKSGPPPDLVTQVRSPQFLAAAKRVAAYAKDRCGIDPSASPFG